MVVIVTIALAEYRWHGLRSMLSKGYAEPDVAVKEVHFTWGLNILILNDANKPEKND